jgi:DNA-binding protein YbaB
VSAEFERLVAEFEKFQSKIKNVDDQLGGIQRMQSELTELEATAVSADRSITVVAGPGGAITDVRFTEEALRQQPQALSSALMTTLRQAVAESARKQAAIVDEHMGAQLGLTDQVLETQAQLFGTSEDELRERLAEETPERPRPAEEEHHDDYSQQSFLQDGDSEPQRPSTPPPSTGGSQGDDFLRNLFDDDDRR